MYRTSVSEAAVVSACSHHSMPIANRVSLLRQIRSPDLPDYRLLASKEALKLTPKLLEELLEIARAEHARLRALRPVTASFDTVVVPLLRLDRDLMVFWSFLSNLNGADTRDDVRSVIERYQPAMTRLGNEITLDSRLYALLMAVKKDRSLTAQQKRSLQLITESMEREGVHLNPADKKRLKKINTELSVLAEKFMRNCVDARKSFFHRIEKEKLLGEMPDEEKQAALAEAKKRKLSGYVFTLSPPSYIAIVRYCTDRATRKLFYREEVSVATRGAHDNRPIILRILRLRREKAQILGQRDFAAYALRSRMAKSVREIRSLLIPYWRRCRAKARKDLQQLKNYSGLASVHPWDIAFYKEKMKRETLKLSDAELQPYFPLESVQAGLFLMAKKLYDIDMKRLPRESYADQARSFEVRRAGKRIGYYVLDLFARPTKRVGAWAECLREPALAGAESSLPIVVNVCSFGGGGKKGPVLLKHLEVETLFHEFGHALHVLLSEGRYENLNGFHTEWDFVELPSQLMENWCTEGEALSLFARHHKTGERIPDRLLARMKKSRNFFGGLADTGQCEYSLLDLLLHTSPPPKTPAALDAMCRRHNATTGVLPVPAFARKHASFAHIFAGGYAAGYYSYLWSEILEADVFATMKREGMLKRSTGERFRKAVLAAGASRPGKELFTAYVGREPDVRSLLRRKDLL